MSSSNRAGLSLTETLIASALLLLVSAVVFSMLVPMLGRSVKLDEKEENLQRIVVLRHHLGLRLRPSHILRVLPDRVEFQAPARVATPHGNLIQIGPDEMVAYDETRTFEITGEPRPDGLFVVDREVGTSGGRSLWNLGPGAASLSFSLTRPILTVQVTATTGRFSGGSWQSGFDLVLPNAP